MTLAQEIAALKAEKQTALKRDAVELLYRNTLSGMFVTVVASFMLVYYFVTPQTQSFKFAWLACMLIICCARVIDYYYWHKNLRATAYSPKVPLVRFSVGSLLTATMWAVYGVGQFNQLNSIELTTIIVVLSAFAGGATSILAGSMLLSMLYCSLLLMPLSFSLLVISDEYQVLGVLGFLFSIVMIVTSMKTARFAIQSIYTRHMNEDLVNELEFKNQQIITVNSSLEAKVAERTQAIYQLSNTDPLTGLFNRNGFTHALKAHLSKARQANALRAVLFIDLDGFKMLNDASGHALGDKVLVEVAKTLGLLSQSPMHLCRWGGDEFILVLEYSHLDEVYTTAGKLIDVLSTPMSIEGGSFQVGATIGVSLFPEHGDDDSALIANADTAMYVQKQKNSGQVCIFDHEMRDAQTREHMLKNAIPIALQEDQFTLVYQPIINNKTGTVAFCEVLIRWQLDGEFIPPLDFIPVAEKYGFINQVGEWVLNTACAQMSTWDLDADVGLSINVSIAQLMYSDIAAVLKSALTRHGIAPRAIHIEVTESVFAENMQEVLVQIRGLHDLGVKVSVDDFGTGFSSLKQLQDLCADVVKIDKTFVHSMEQGGRAIIQATQYMSGEFGYMVVAEGVETKEQADILRSMGISCSQGYYFCRPMPLEDLGAWHRGFLITQTQRMAESASS